MRTLKILLILFVYFLLHAKTSKILKTEQYGIIWMELQRMKKNTVKL